MREFTADKQGFKQFAHLLPHAQRIAFDGMVAVEVCTLEDIVERQQHLTDIDRWRQSDFCALRHVR